MFKFISFLFVPYLLFAHCQMPCGIYNDSLVIGTVDEYIQTMYKACKEIPHFEMGSGEGRNQAVRWIQLKDEESNRIANLLMTYFLQQKIPIEGPKTAEQLSSIHRLLVALVKIKQECDPKTVQTFEKEWKAFSAAWQDKPIKRPDLKEKIESVEIGEPSMGGRPKI